MGYRQFFPSPNHKKYGNSQERQDKKWIYATLSNCYYGLDNAMKADEYENSFRQEGPEDWEINTFAKSREIITALLTK